jgi:hypothetical protein
MHKQINQHIIWSSVKELLFKHDCVIVPDFGGFVCNVEQSKIDQVSHVITPPGKKIVFNQNLKTNDGLLAQTLAEKLKISYAEALIEIHNLVDQLRHQLEAIKQCDIDAFGSFRLNAEANYVFLPDKLNTYLHASFGLIPIQASKVSGLNKRAPQTRIFKDRKEVREARKIVRAKHVGLKLLTATLVVMLMLNGYIFLTDANLIGGAKINTTGINSWFDSLVSSKKHQEPVQHNQPVLTDEPTELVIDTAEVIIHEPVADIAQETTSEESTYAAEHHVLAVAETFAGLHKKIPAYGSTEITTEATPEEVIEETNNSIPTKTSVKPSGTFSYHVIGGVFCKEKNARKFYQELKEKGFEAELLLNPKINCNRVSYRKVKTLQEAIELMDSIKGTINNEAWVLTTKE